MGTPPGVELKFLIGDERAKAHPEVRSLFSHKGVTQDNLGKILRAHPQVKWLHSWTTGFDNIEGVPELIHSDIVLTNAKDCFSESLGEFIPLGMLYFSKKLPLFLKQQTEHKWSNTPVEMLQGKTLVIVGYGDIGMHVAKRAKLGFEMKVVGVKRSPAAATEEAKKYVDHIVGLDGLEQAMREGDYVCSILPGIKDNIHFFNEERLGWLKESAVFMSIGRGVVVKEEALIPLLEKNKIRGRKSQEHSKQGICI